MSNYQLHKKWGAHKKQYMQTTYITYAEDMRPQIEQENASFS